MSVNETGSTMTATVPAASPWGEPYPPTLVYPGSTMRRCYICSERAVALVLSENLHYCLPCLEEWCHSVEDAAPDPWRLG